MSTWSLKNIDGDPKTFKMFIMSTWSPRKASLIGKNLFLDRSVWLCSICEGEYNIKNVGGNIRQEIMSLLYLCNQGGFARSVNRILNEGGKIRQGVMLLLYLCNQGVFARSVKKNFVLE